ncbi:MAG: F0F1 ATP synthase subunit B [Algisphaera sp.]
MKTSLTARLTAPFVIVAALAPMAAATSPATNDNPLAPDHNSTTPTISPVNDTVQAIENASEHAAGHEIDVAADHAAAEVLNKDTHGNDLTETAAHASEAHTGDADHKAPPLINPLVSEMIWALVVFGLFFAVLSTVVWPKILGALQARENKQRDDLTTAENAAKQAQASIAEYEQKLSEARKEAQGIVAEARGAAQQAANADKTKIEAEIATLKTSAKADIASAKEQALTDIYAQTAALSTAVAGKILQREITADDQQSLINDSLAQFKKANG